MGKVIIASDSFKGSLSSLEVAQAVCEGLPAGCPFEVLSVSDGGEGFCAAVHAAVGGEWITVPVHDPLMRPIQASYLLTTVPASLFAAPSEPPSEPSAAPSSPDVRCAVIEVAAASGLTILHPDERDVLHATTFGTGELIAHACRQGIHHLLIGLGGSATNDCGRGLLAALGLPDAAALGLPDAAAPTTLSIPFPLDALHIIGCTDVRSPLCGPDGATYLFARQKGATEAQLPSLESRNRAFGEWLEQTQSRPIMSEPGAGAAGGVGAALLSLPHSRLCSGASLILDLQHFDERLADASLVITGEGCLDSQTLLGKIPFIVALRAQSKGIPCLALAGRVLLSPAALSTAPWTTVLAVTPPSLPLPAALRPSLAKAHIKAALQSHPPRVLTPPSPSPRIPTPRIPTPPSSSPRVLTPPSSSPSSMPHLLFYSLGPSVTAFSTERDAELPFPVVQAHQVHGDVIREVTSPSTTREDLEGVDALLTNIPGLAIGARTADCIPVLLYDEPHHAVAAVHAGWRGTVLAITAKAIRRMTALYGTYPASLKAIIGPGIGPDSFQVGEEVVDAFREAGFPMDTIHTYRGPRIEGTMEGGHHLDLWEANRWLLLQSGLLPANIHVAAICTYAHNARFYSARREGIRCPRIITAIRLTP